MVTGIETAGIALAVFPLLISGLQSYADGIRTIKELWHPQLALNSLIRELGMEKCKFDNTCASLLEGMVTDAHLTLLMENPGGLPWSDPDLQEKLDSRFRPETLACYIDAMKDLASTLRTLQDSLGLDGDDTPKPFEKKTHKKKLKKMMIVFSKAEHKELLQNITKINYNLATLTGQSKSANSSRQRTTTAKHYTRIRDHAINLFGVLKERLQAASACACTLPHNATLRLEVRNAQKNQYTKLRFHVVLSLENDPAAAKSLPCNWREMRLEPIDSEKEQVKVKISGSDDKGNHLDMPPRFTETPDIIDNTKDYPATDNTTRSRRAIGPRGHSEPSITERVKSTLGRVVPERFMGLYSKNTPKPRVAFVLPQTSCTDPPPTISSNIPKHTTEQIQNLCLAIQRAKNETSCLGVLIGGGGGQYRVWPLMEPLPTSEPTGVLSLESLLAQSGALKKRERLILGVQLASTVMQLHKTEWLGENWGKRDILFYKKATRGESGSAATISPVLKPLVRRSFAPQSPPLPSPQNSVRSIIIPQDQSLFSLGVILMELWYGKRLEDLQIETDRTGIGGASDMTDHITAKRLIDEVSEDAGEKYGDAVRRCINGLDHRFSNLEKEDFKNEVHMKVVSPLVENLEAFCAKGLVDLLNEKS